MDSIRRSKNKPMKIYKKTPEQSDYSHIKTFINKSYSSYALVDILNTFFEDISCIFVKMHSNDFYTYKVWLIAKLPPDRSFYSEKEYALLIERMYFPLPTSFAKNLGGKSDHALLSISEFMENFNNNPWNVWHIKMKGE